MGSKGPHISEEIICSDSSDCEIEEVDIKSITIPDSPESSLVVINTDDEAQDKTEEQSKIELETTNEFSKLNDDRLIFEVNFKNERLFNVYKDLVLESLRGSLEEKGFLIVEDDSAIQVFQGLMVDEDETNISSRAENSVEASKDSFQSKSDGDSLGLKIEDSDQKEDVKPHCEEDNYGDDDDGDMNIAGLFMVDTQPAENIKAVEVPSYKRAIKEFLDESSSQKKMKNEDECERPKQKKLCFNCDDSTHDVRTCPKPRNYSKINKAKKLLTAGRDRYHVDIEQRYAHLRPGQISKNLREALGISSGELPFFFYRMRLLGYPPGWLEDARVAHSGIVLFDSEGRSVRDPEEEEGEIDSQKNKYDVNKIISFPGFNTNPGDNFYDDYKHHNVPPLNQENMKERFIEMLGSNIVKGYKRKKLKDLPESDGIDKQISVDSEMEIEDLDNSTIDNVEFSRPPPPPSLPHDSDLPAPPPPPPPPPISDSPKNSVNRSPSPTLEDLEKKQKLLQQLLQSSTILISDNDDSLIDEVLELETDTDKSSVKNDDSLVDEALDLELNAEKSSISLTSTPNKSQHSIGKTASVLSNHGEKETETETESESNIGTQESDTLEKTSKMDLVLGTPLLKFSPFDKLPSGDNFKVGVSDVINFENLPDSTGTYEKMKDVIKNVRTILTKLQNDDS